jgi:hypothetical protein
VSLEAVATFTVPGAIVQQTENRLQAAGHDGYELFVLWSGHRTGSRFDVIDGHVPQQSSYKTETGLVVRVDGEALHRLNVWLFENKQELACQIHAHPDEAFHSETDSAFPMVTALGGLSLVAADFCRDGLVSQTTAVFRLSAAGWVEVPIDIIRVT